MRSETLFNRAVLKTRGHSSGYDVFNKFPNDCTYRARCKIYNLIMLLKTVYFQSVSASDCRNSILSGIQASVSLSNQSYRQINFAPLFSCFQTIQITKILVICCLQECDKNQTNFRAYARNLQICLFYAVRSY